MTWSALPALAAVALVVALLRADSIRAASGTALAAVGVASLATTATVGVSDPVAVDTSEGVATQIETIATLALTVLAARWAPIRHVAVGACVAAVALGTVVFRFSDPADDAATVVGAAVWALVGLAAAGIGLYLRALDMRRLRSVADAQHAQRVHLARDLHDFVAHDVSEMLAQARAGQIVAAAHPRCADTFAKIESAAQRALRSMDQTVHMLHVTGGDRHEVRLDLTELRDLVGRFSDANGIRTAVEMAGITDAGVAALPQDVSATLYRVAVEALTNVRRHAAGASTVMVRLRRGAPAGLTLEITDDAPPGPASHDRPESRHNGLGLPTLRDRVERLGGHLAAGPGPVTGWRVTATVPSRPGVGA